MFEPGDRVVTESGRKGTIVKAYCSMPYHYFIRFDHDDSRPWWITRDSVKAIVEKAK